LRCFSTSYVERANLSIRMGSRRFTRLTNGFSKKLECHAAAVSLYVAHYNWCRMHETLDTTPAVTLGIADRPWSIGDWTPRLRSRHRNQPRRRQIGGDGSK
jgi:hypothetical protein